MTTQQRALVFLDDEREFKDVTWVNYQDEYVPENIHVARNIQDFISMAKALHTDGYLVDFSFDHDLQCFEEDGMEITGKCCLKYLCNVHIIGGIDISNSKMYFHTMNPVGRENMESFYESFKTVILDGNK